ncbi:metal ABC transporter substrate-binding protein [Pseudalkalibacillus caeni]|uniref:Adhesin n=1 Tax=Exobacillus caeni TaxID=2574798 RepID=A0A5R9F727_9BACL|nr:metal ABC transporter substrate-binding protein [Pseudalkalibacillus caeni]TLS38146.1 adhesin [Pseudalkalibacillus caeni]
MHFKRAIIFLSSILLTVALSGCSDKNDNSADQKASDDGKLQVYTTLYPLEDFTKKIGGKHVSVESIIPSGSDAHNFEPTTKTMMKLAGADLFIYNGAGMEGYAKTIHEAMENEDVTILEAAQGIDLLKDTHEHEDHSEGHEEHGDQDPHIWIDPILATEMAKNIKDELVALKPEAEEDFETNFNSLKENLLALDKSFQTMVGNSQQKQILVAHAGYGYWEKRYQLEQISVTGISPSNEPSQKELKRLIEKAEKYNIDYILFEQNVTPKPAKVIQKEAGLKPLRLHNLAVLTEEDIKNGEDYFSLMEENLATLKKALN